MFKKAQRYRLYELIAEDVEKSILAGTFEVGSRLPSEQNLAEQFEVSRNVVREALKILQERGLVEVLDGSGAYICKPNTDATKNALGRYIRLMSSVTTLRDLYEARRILEGWNVRLAAQRANAADLEEMQRHLETMKENLEKSIEKWTEADLEFHMAVAKASHNPFLTMLLEPLVDQLREVITEGYFSPGAVTTGLEAHLKVFGGIARNDPEGAYQAMMDHLRDSEDRVEHTSQHNGAQVLS